MKRFLSVMTIGAVSLTALATTAHAQLIPTLGIYAGAAIPTGGLADETGAGARQGTGYTLGVNVGFKPPLSPIGLRADADFSQFSQSSGGTALQQSVIGDVRIFQASANLIFSMLSVPMASPYLIGGGGIYNVDYSGSAASSTKPGVNVGAGIKFGLLGFGAHIEGRFHTIFGDNSVKTHYVPITVGVNF